MLLPALAILGVWLAVESPVSVPAWGPGVAAAVLLLARLVLGRSRLAVLAPFALALAAVCAGAFALLLQSELFGTAMLKAPVTVTLEGTVLKVEPKSSGTQRVIVRVTGGLEAPVPRRVRITVRGAEPLPVGVPLRVRARLFPINGPAIVGGYDPARRLYFDGIGATGFSYGPPEITGPPQKGLRTVAADLRAKVVARIMTVDPPAASFAVALLVGERGLMDEEDVEALRASGLGHILAISGLHMALFAGSVFALTRLVLALLPGLALSYPIKKWAAVTSLAAATFYLVLSGASVATVRAYLMLSIALLAILADRPALTMRSVALAAGALIAVDPISALEPGFQMSFLAVVALVGGYEWWAGRRVKLVNGFGRPVLAFFIGLAVTSLIAGLATAPAAAFHFQRLAPLGLIANLAAMPVMSLVAMPAGVLSLAAMPFGLEWLPLHVMGGGLDVILLAARKVASWTGPSGLTGAVPMASAILAAVGLVILCVLTAPWRLGGIALIAAGLSLTPFAPAADVMVSPDGQSVAVRAPDGTVWLARTTGRFAGEMMLKSAADPRTVREAKAGNCDAGGCVIASAHGPVALPQTPLAALEDCHRAVLVVSRTALPGCRAPRLVDRGELVAGGAVSLFKEASGWRTVHAMPDGPEKPWQVPPVVRD